MLSDTCRVKFVSNGVALICLPLYFQGDLSDVDIIIGRFEIPLLIKSDALDENRLYYYILIVRVYMSDLADASSRLACCRAVSLDEPTSALVKKLTVRELESENRSSR